MHIICQDQKIFIDQTDYLRKILQHFQIEDMCSTSTLFLARYYPQKHEEPVEPYLQKCYQMIIGFLLYLSRTCGAGAE